MTLKTMSIARPHRQEARATRSTTYFTGLPCSNGHIAKRNTVDASRCACRQEFRERNRENARRYMQEKRKRALLEDPITTRATWNAANRERRLRNPEAVQATERRNGRIKRQRHPQRKLADTRARQIAKLQRTPHWADLAEIKKFYEDCPRGMVVDHIIPLRGKIVSGLHVRSNLQYLTRDDNLRKGNTFESQEYRYD